MEIAGDTPLRLRFRACVSTVAISLNILVVRICQGAAFTIWRVFGDASGPAGFLS